MPATKGKVTCKVCSRVFNSLDWLENTQCDRPDQCSCPKVQQSMKAAQQVIDNANTLAKNNIKIITHPIPTERSSTEKQLYIDVQPIQVIKIVPPTQRGRSKKGS